MKFARSMHWQKAGAVTTTWPKRRRTGLCRSDLSGHPDYLLALRHFCHCCRAYHTASQRYDNFTGCQL